MKEKKKKFCTNDPGCHVRPPYATYRVTSLIRNSAPLGPYIRNVPRALWWS